MIGRISKKKGKKQTPDYEEVAKQVLTDTESRQIAYVQSSTKANSNGDHLFEPYDGTMPGGHAADGAVTYKFQNNTEDGYKADDHDEAEVMSMLP